MVSLNKRYLSKEEALKKLQHYCAYQERSHQEVRTKLLSLGQRGEALEEIIVKLVEENFLNEERFAKAFARGKFRMKKWGRNKIKLTLKQKEISDYCIKEGMKEIDEKEYDKTLTDLVNKKLKSLTGNKFIKSDKILKYLINKGYEPTLITEKLKRFLS